MIAVPHRRQLLPHASIPSRSGGRTGTTVNHSLRSAAFRKASARLAPGDRAGGDKEMLPAGAYPVHHCFGGNAIYGFALGDVAFRRG